MKNITPLTDPQCNVISPEEIVEAAGAPVVSVQRAAQLTGGLMSEKTIFNLISLKDAPERIKLGRRSGFRTAEFAEWLCDRLQAA